MFRITSDPAPRFLYCFDTDDGGKSVTAGALVQRIKAGDIGAHELIVGVGDLDSPLAKQLAKVGVETKGVKSARDAAVAKIKTELGIKE